MEKENNGTHRYPKPRVSKSKQAEAEAPKLPAHRLQLREQYADSFILTKDDEQEIIKILYGPKITRESFYALPRKERNCLISVFNKGVNRLALEDRQRFLEKIDEIMQHDTRRDIWEQNHFHIMKAIDDLTRKYNRFPSRNEIQQETNLSRKTIFKHLREYFGSEVYAEKKDEYFAMRESILARLYISASNGSVRAAKVFLDATAFTAEPPKVHTQTNYLQFNSLTITQAQINQLPEPERNAFFDIVKKFTPAAETVKQEAGATTQEETVTT